MNLTCGRNPWKRASMDDSTFRAYRTNPKFLSSILPLSSELDAILARIFESDPCKRISIPELRALILKCSRFTTRSCVVSPPTPPSEPQYQPKVPLQAVPEFLESLESCSAASDVPTALSENPIMAQLSTSSKASFDSEHGSTFSAASSCSSVSSQESLDSVSKIQNLHFAPPQLSTQSQPAQCFHNYYPLDPVPGTVMPQPYLASVQVC